MLQDQEILFYFWIILINETWPGLGFDDVLWTFLTYLINMCISSWPWIIGFNRRLFPNRNIFQLISTFSKGVCKVRSSLVIWFNDFIMAGRWIFSIEINLLFNVNKSLFSAPWWNFLDFRVDGKLYNDEFSLMKRIRIWIIKSRCLWKRK